ncbi:site-specific DNA-methyltransferase [Flavobacterium sp.]|uniref:site-specific DNA-methyltransferase n=5 Tax=Flavobacterium sp. TaxID=239 RepID=UPI004047C440
MNKQDLISKIKQLDGISQDERAYLINLVNTKKKYGLVWEDKPEAVEEQLRENLPVLKEVKEKAIINGEDNPNHILIEGDNLHALTALTFTHEGKIDVIYIDPPYNTGNKDFKYHDTFKDDPEFIEKEHPFRHSTWLSFMNKRLKIAKRLLNNKGIIFISIDDNEFCQLKMLCDEVFGENNCENIFTIKVRHENRILRQDIRYHQTTEYLLAYRKTNEFIPPRRINERDVDNDYKFNIVLNNPPSKIEKIGGYDVEVYDSGSYSLVQTNPGEGELKSYSIRGSLITQSGSASEFYEKKLRERKKQDGFNTLYKVINMGTRGDGLGYRFIMQPPNSSVRNGIYFQGKPIKSKTDTGLPYPNFFDFVNEFNNVGYEGGVDFKNGKKPLDFLNKVFELANLSNNSTILDFFGGSGSTLHSVMQLNQKLSYSNNCIIVTNNENNICEKITYSRLKNVIDGYTYNNSNQIEGLTNNNLRYYKSEFVSRDTSLKNKRELTYLATELLCIKEDCYSEFPSKEKWFKAFTSKSSQFIVIYDEVYIEDSFKIIEALHAQKTNDNPVKVYVFSHGQYPYTEDFEEVLPLITLCALPDAIYKAYQNVLPKKKREVIPVLDEDQLDEEENLFNQSR